MSATRYNMRTDTIFIDNMSSNEILEICTCCYPRVCGIMELSRQIAIVKKKLILCYCLWP